MNRQLNLPDGFITVLEARTRHGRALYGERWPEIEKASDAQVSLGEDLIKKMAAGIDAAGETIQSLGEGVVEAAKKSWKYRTRTVTDLLDGFCSGALKGYLSRPGRMPELQSSGVWRDPKFIHALLTGYIDEAELGQQRKAYVIVRVDELRSLLTDLGLPRPDGADQPPISQSDGDGTGQATETWEEKRARQGERDAPQAHDAQPSIPIKADQTRTDDEPKTLRDRAEGWLEAMEGLRETQKISWRGAAKQIAGSVGVDPATVEREGRRIRQERDEAGEKSGENF